MITPPYYLIFIKAFTNIVVVDRYIYSLCRIALSVAFVAGAVAILYIIQIGLEYIRKRRQVNIDWLRLTFCILYVAFLLDIGDECDHAIDYVLMYQIDERVAYEETLYNVRILEDKIDWEDFNEKFEIVSKQYDDTYIIRDKEPHGSE